MNDKDSKGSGSTTAIIIVGAVLRLGLTCLAVVGLFGAGVLFYSHGARDMLSAVESKPMIQESPPTVEPQAPVESAVPDPAEDGN